MFHHTSLGSAPGCALPDTAVCRGECAWLFDGLDGRARDWMRRVSRQVQYGAGEVVFQTGELAFGFYLVCAGKVKLSQHAGGGKRQILKLLGAGDLLGEEMMFDRELYTACAKTLAPTTFHFIARNEFEAFLRDYPAVALRLIRKLAHEVKAYQSKLVELAYEGSAGRLARLLLAISDRYGEPAGDGTDIGFELTRGELGQLAGLSTETAIRTLAKFRDRGWVELNGRHIVLRSRAALAGLLEPFDAPRPGRVLALA